MRVREREKKDGWVLCWANKYTMNLLLKFAIVVTNNKMRVVVGWREGGGGAGGG